MYAYTRKAHKFKKNIDLNMVHCYNLQMGKILANLLLGARIALNQTPQNLIVNPGVS